MNFLNVDPLFTYYNKQFIEFYFYGESDTSVVNILHVLENGGFPYNIKGNFAFFYKDPRRVVFAVDHLPSIDLYYTDDKVCHVFSQLKEEGQEDNLIVRNQMKFFHGTYYGTDTTIIGIKRLEQATFFEKKLVSGDITIKKYVNPYAHTIDNNVTVEDISHIVEDAVERHTREPFNLLLSSGTDSNCILGFIRKLKRTDRCSLISLWGDEGVYDEMHQIDKILKCYNLKSTSYKFGRYVGKTSSAINRYNDPDESKLYKDNFDRIFSGNIFNSTIWQKFESIYDTGNVNKVTLTGELGDEFFGAGSAHLNLKYILQNPNYETRHMVILTCFYHIFKTKELSIRETTQWQRCISHDRYRQSAWDSAIEYLIKIYDSIETDDILNKIKIFFYYLLSPWRNLPYTQFSVARFYHPFNDYRLFYHMWKIPGHIKFSHKQLARQVSYDIIKDYVVDLPWRMKKIGPSLITEDSLNRFRNQQ